MSTEQSKWLTVCREIRVGSIELDYIFLNYDRAILNIQMVGDAAWIVAKYGKYFDSFLELIDDNVFNVICKYTLIFPTLTVRTLTMVIISRSCFASYRTWMERRNKISRLNNLWYFFFFFMFCRRRRHTGCSAHVSLYLNGVCNVILKRFMFWNMCALTRLLSNVFPSPPKI